MDAEDLLLREFLGLHDDAVIAAAARWIRHQQREDGTWANFYGGPADLSTTVEAYLALRLAGDDPGDPHMKLACDWITDQGGVEATRVFTRIWLALSGLWSWDDLPVIPPELIYLPSWFPLNIYDWGCWARQTIVALAVVQSFRPSRPIGLSIDELKTGGPHGRAPRPRRDLDARPVGGVTSSTDPWARAFDALDQALHKYRPVKSVRRAALRRCAEWIIARQEKDGCWGGIQPPWVYSLMALNLLGYELDHPVMAKGLAGLDRFTITEDSAGQGGPQGPVRRLEACQSPVWDTVLTMTALADAGLAPDDPSLTRAARWVLDEEIHGPGDWQVRRPETAPGGWAFEFDNDNYPDTDDTAEVVLALRRVAVPQPARHRPGHGLADRDAVQGRRLGRVRRGQHPRAGQQAAVLRLRRGHRPALGRRHRAHRGGVRRRGPGRRARRPPRRGLAAAEPGAGRFLVRPLGRELPVRHRSRRPRADRGRGQAVQAGHPPRRGLARAAPEPGRRLGRGPALLRRPGAVRAGRLDRVADRVGAARPARGGGTGESRHRARASAGWRRRSGPTGPGTSPGSPAPASPATSTSTITCTGWPSRSVPSAGTSMEVTNDRRDHLCPHASGGPRDPPGTAGQR